MSLEHIFKLGISSVDAIRLYPEFEIELGKVKIQDNHKTKSGRSFNYLWSVYERIDIPIEFISANNAAIINSWWESDTKLLFFRTFEGGSYTQVESGYLELVGGSGGLELVGGSGYLELIEISQTMTISSTEISSVYIMNKKQPFRQYSKPYNIYQNGSIILETY